MFKSLTLGAIALLAAIVVVLASLTGITWAYVAQKDGRELVQHTMKVEIRIYRLQSLLDDAETGQRGYLLTDDARFLAPYLAVLPAIDGELAALAALTLDNPVQQKTLATLSQQTEERLALLKRGIDFRQAGDEPQALALIRGGAGRELMDRMRQTLARMVAEEERLLEIRQRAQDRNYLALLAGILLTLVVAVALGVLAIRNERQKQSLLASRDAADKTSEEDNTREANTADDNAAKDKTPRDNVPKDNVPEDNTPKDDAAKDKTPKDKTVKDKTAKDKTPKDKTPKDEPAKGKTAEPAVS